MTAASNFTATTFVPGGTYLEVEGKRFAVVGFTTNWAVNDIPTAECLLAVGRSTSAWKLADIHSQPPWKQMTRARLICTPKSGFRAHRSWSGRPFVVFDGYITNTAPSKSSNKTQLSVNLVHWLIDLALSSSLSPELYPGDMASLAVPAIVRSGAASALAPNYTTAQVVSAFLNSAAFQMLVQQDVWAAIKTMFTAFCLNTTGSAFAELCVQDRLSNQRGLEALKRIEGPALMVQPSSGPSTSTSMDYKYGRPLRIQTPQPVEVSRLISEALQGESLGTVATSSLWDKLIHSYLPMLGLAIVPMVDRAVVIADTPILSVGATASAIQVWDTVYAEDCEGSGTSNSLERPLRGVVVVAPAEQGMLGAGAQKVLPGGCYISPRIDPGDGMILPINPPAWFHSVSASNSLRGNLGPGTNSVDMQPFYYAWAREAFTRQVLRGRLHTVSGPLRLDIAPGSIIRVINASDKAVNKRWTQPDNLAMPLYGCVSRMTVAVNADAPAASTVYQLSFTRTEPEYLDYHYTAVPYHPFFGSAIHGGGKHGCPLITDAELEKWYA